MCRIFAEQDPQRYRLINRKVRLGGHSTSVCLEAVFWEILEEIAAAQELTLGRFLTVLHDEVLEFAADRKNFTGLLRCACLTYLTEVKPDLVEQQRLTEEAAHKAVAGFNRAAAAA